MRAEVEGGGGGVCGRCVSAVCAQNFLSLILGADALRYHMNANAKNKYFPLLVIASSSKFCVYALKINAYVNKRATRRENTYHAIILQLHLD